MQARQDSWSSHRWPSTAQDGKSQGTDVQRTLQQPWMHVASGLLDTVLTFETGVPLRKLSIAPAMALDRQARGHGGADRSAKGRASPGQAQKPGTQGKQLPLCGVQPWPVYEVSNMAVQPL